MILRTPAAFALLAGAALFAAAPAVADEGHHGHAEATTHSAVGAQFMVMETSGNEAARAPFLRGLALLHNFEYTSAAEEFRRAQEADPDFVMAYWGEAMTYNHPVWEQQDFAARGSGTGVHLRGPAAG